MSRAFLLIGLPAQTDLLGGLTAMIPLSIAMALSKESPGKSKSELLLVFFDRVEHPHS